MNKDISIRISYSTISAKQNILPSAGTLCNTPQSCTGSSMNPYFYWNPNHVDSPDPAFTLLSSPTHPLEILRLSRYGLIGPYEETWIVESQRPALYLIKREHQIVLFFDYLNKCYDATCETEVIYSIIPLRVVLFG